LMVVRFARRVREYQGFSRRFRDRTVAASTDH
jgi:hypothetical protein